jgi:hypothetical protein
MAMGKLGRRGGFASGGALGSVNGWPSGTPFEQSGGSTPWAHPEMGRSAVRDSTRSKTFLTWERAFPSTGKRVLMACSRDDSNNWAGDYLAAVNTLSADNHGVPAITVDASGFWYCFYGAHDTPIQVSSTATANDPSVWYAQTAIGTTHTFPQPETVGSKIYLFVNAPSPSNAAKTQGAIQVYTLTPSSGALTVSASKIIADGYDGSDAWLPVSETCVNGTDIHLVFAWGKFNGWTITGNYYLIFDTLTGNVRNFSGSRVVVPASQPINKADLDTYFKIASVTCGGTPSLAIDGNGASHVVIYDGSVVNFNTGNNGVAKYLTGTAGGSLSAPLLLQTWPALVDPASANSGIVINSSGGIDVYFPDGVSGYVYPGAGGLPSGNIVRFSRSSGGVWTGSKRTMGKGSRGLDFPTNVRNSASGLRMVCTEVSSDYFTVLGNLAGYGFDDTATNVVRASVANASQVAAFLARTTALNAAHAAAYTELINGLVADGLWTTFDGLYVLGTQDQTNAALNLISASFPLTKNGAPTFVADRGYTGVDGSSIWLDSGYNPTNNATNYTLNNASIFAWTLTTGSPWAGDTAGSYNGAGQVTADVAYSGSNNFFSRFNKSSGSVASSAVASDVGLIGASMVSGTTVNLYYNGAAAGSGAVTPDGLPNGTMKLCGAGASDGSGAQTFCGGWGGALTTKQWRQLWQRLYVFGAAVGAVT